MTAERITLQGAEVSSEPATVERVTLETGADNSMDDATRAMVREWIEMYRGNVDAVARYVARAPGRLQGDRRGCAQACRCGN